MKQILPWLTSTFQFRKDKIGSVELDVGYFANVIALGHGLGLAVSTDGVGTKIMVAEMVGKYDTIGIDCIAMNVNDVICVGAEPISFLDYIAIGDIDDEIMEEIFKGLHEGARQAQVSIPGGETARVPEMLRGIGKNVDAGLDLVGTCIGIVSLDRIITGQDLKKGDVIIGLKSSGVHSNGLTRARKTFFGKLKWQVDKYVPELKRTIGEELLEPTTIYAPIVNELLAKEIEVKALVNITSDGFLNLSRIPHNFGYNIDNLPDPHPIFHLIQEYGTVRDEDMYYDYNMGMGFCIIVSENNVESVMQIAGRHQVDSCRIGSVTADSERQVFIEQKSLLGKDKRFMKI